jgi:hypothetical protein
LLVAKVALLLVAKLGLALNSGPLSFFLAWRGSIQGSYIQKLFEFVFLFGNGGVEEV